MLQQFDEMAESTGASITRPIDPENPPLGPEFDPIMPPANRSTTVICDWRVLRNAELVEVRR
jgi:hypothetical protein